jgi:hypothetical protein
LHNPQVVDNYYKTLAAASRNNGTYSSTERVVHDLEQTTWLRAVKALNALDTEEAIRQRVSIAHLTLEDERRSDGRLPWSWVIASTIRPDLMVTALEDRAREPALAVDSRFAGFLIVYLMRRDHPDFYQPSEGDAERLNKPAQWGTHEIEAKQKLVPFLQSILPIKTGAAKEVTVVTLKTLERDIGRTNLNP